MGLPLLPHMMRDTHMPRMINIEPYVFATYEQLLLTGLPSVQHCGTPTYERLSSVDAISLCIPAALADNSFHGVAVLLTADQRKVNSLLKGNNGHPRIITSEKVECGRFWALDISAIDKTFEEPGTLGRPP